MAVMAIATVFLAGCGHTASNEANLTPTAESITSNPPPTAASGISHANATAQSVATEMPATEVGAMTDTPSGIPDSASAASEAPDSTPVQDAEPTPVPGILQVSTAEAAKMLEEETGYALVDARPAADFERLHIPGSINIPNESVDSTPPPELPDKGQRIFLYCGGGGLSYYLAVKLHDMGYTNLVKFAGMNEWEGSVEGLDAPK